MSHSLLPDLLKATRLTRGGRLREATATLQQSLRSQTPSKVKISGDRVDGDRMRVIDGMYEEVNEGSSPSMTARSPNPTPRAGEPNHALKSLSSHLPAAMRDISGRLGRTLGGLMKPSESSAGLVPAGGRFITGSYSNGVGTRAFKLYVPSGYEGQACPLLVMLHGCTQSPDDFAAGTRMNLIAEEQTCLIVYPEQSQAANPSKCWNWFNAGDQQRDQGEPALIAGITRKIMREYAIDPRQVYIAGLSAGGAAAAVMGSTYPDLYAAIGVHSGLACGAASDMASAFAAMKQGGAAAGLFSSNGIGSHKAGIVPTIVFHGDQDLTVHPGNADRVIAQSLAGPTVLARQLQRGQVPGGYAYSRSIHTDENGRTLLEQWVVHGLGHAWSGGSAAGSYTDPRGPDATREMVRFFLDHAHPASAC